MELFARPPSVSKFLSVILLNGDVGRGERDRERDLSPPGVMS